jgi:hypothetical protein
MLVLAYKNFAAAKHISHIGLGVAALNTSKVLARAGVPAEVWPIVDANELRQRLHLAKDPITCVVVSAPWIPTSSWMSLIQLFPHVRFAVCCHSNVGFLQADSNGVAVFREALDLEMGLADFRAGANSEKFCQWVNDAYGRPCAWLPNLYYLDKPVQRPLWRGGPLRIGAFGATRPLKNFMSAAGAALTLARTLKSNLELWVSSGRAEGGGDTIMRAVHAMLDLVPGVSIVESGWQSWPKFRQIAGHMHLLLQPSYTESFNMVTADGVAEGVPSVVSDAIDWAPQHWKANVDDVFDIARVGRYLLSDSNAAADGWKALEDHNSKGLEAWRTFLG